MWVKVNNDANSYLSSVGNETDTYYRLEDIPYLEVRGPAANGSYYIGCEATGATVYLAPGYAAQADAEAALDAFVRTEDAGGLTSP